MRKNTRIAKRLRAESGILRSGGELLFKKNYFDESWYTVALDGAVLSLADRKLSTYINALAENGFVIEKLVEQSDDERLGSEQGGFAAKARMLPATFVIKARKQ